MKKRLFACAAGAALLTGGAVAASPGGSAHGVSSNCSKFFAAENLQGQHSAGPLTSHPFTPKQSQQFGIADNLRNSQILASVC